MRFLHSKEWLKIVLTVHRFQGSKFKVRLIKGGVNSESNVEFIKFLGYVKQACTKAAILILKSNIPLIFLHKHACTKVSKPKTFFSVSSVILLINDPPPQKKRGGAFR